LSEGRHPRAPPRATNATLARDGRLSANPGNAIVIPMTTPLPQPRRAEEPMRNAALDQADPRLPEAFVGAVVALMLLVAAFVSTPASAAPAAEPPGCAAAATPAR
jgi:hypothetical protein